MNIYSRLADLVVIVHAAYVCFVVVGLLLTLLGIALRWPWIRNFWFRAVHLAMIGVVVVQALLGVICPLTTLEFELRQRAGQSPEEGAFLARWAHELLFIDAPPWAFTLCYCLFGGLVLATWFIAPPRGPWKRRRAAPAGEKDRPSGGRA